MKLTRLVFPELKTICCILFMVVATTLSAQNTTKNNYKWGIEYDLMAPRIGAWNSFNLSGYFGHGRIKHSIMLANININNRHLTSESFTKDKLKAIGYRCELFSHKELKRWSAGLLMLYSINNVVTVPHSQEGSFKTFIIGVPLGYTFLLWNHLTINPNVSILYPLTSRTVKIGIDEVSQAPWGLEPGIRIGYRF